MQGFYITLAISSSLLLHSASALIAPTWMSISAPGSTPTPPPSLCSPYEDPSGGNCPGGAIACCQCSGASQMFPTLTSGNDECAYTAMPTITSGNAPATTSPSSYTITDPNSGIVWAYPSYATSQAAGFPITIGEGASTPVSTVTSIYAQATAMAAAAKLDVQYCAYTDSVAGAANQWLVLLPQYRWPYDFSTTWNDFRGSLERWGGCAGYTGWQAGSVGAYNTTFYAGFLASKFCTAYDVSQIINETTGGVTFGCSQYTDSDGSGTDPDTSNLDPATFPGAEDGSDIEKRFAKLPYSYSG